MWYLHAYVEGTDIAVGKRSVLDLSLASYHPHGLQVIPEFGGTQGGEIREREGG